MEMKIYAIYDKIANAYMQPVFKINDGMAVRDIQSAVNEEGKERNPLARNPEDYSLWWIGTYDDQTGELHRGQSGGKPEAKKICELSQLKTTPAVTETELTRLKTEVKEARAVIESLKTLMVGKNTPHVVIAL